MSANGVGCSVDGGRDDRGGTLYDCPIASDGLDVAVGGKWSSIHKKVICESERR